jgi:hypothetical protein
LTTALDCAITTTSDHYLGTTFAALVSFSGSIRHVFTTSGYFV